MGERQGQRLKRRCTVTLSGKALKIWTALPKGVHSLIVSNLLEEAYNCGRLDVFLNRPAGELLTEVSYSSEEKVSPLSRETHRDIQTCSHPSKTVPEAKKAVPRQKEKTTSGVSEWIQELDKEISKIIKLN